MAAAPASAADTELRSGAGGPLQSGENIVVPFVLSQGVELDEKELDLWEERFAAVSVCDTGRADAPCPKAP
ncbi:MAG TPA: hypothetical protein VIW03_09310 [Anaeromyxobacter sp.]